MIINKMSLKSSVFVLLVYIGFSCSKNNNVSINSNDVINRKVDSLLSEMTLKEKLAK